MSEAPLISIVDDDALARDGIRELVESLGYKAITFISAEHFLESGLIEEKICLITDLQMPGLSGLELQDELRSQGYQIPRRDERALDSPTRITPCSGEGRAPFGRQIALVAGMVLIVSGVWLFSMGTS